MKAKTLTKEQLLKLCRYYSARVIVGFRSNSQIETEISDIYDQMLAGTFVEPTYESSKPKPIQPVAGAWSRTTSVDRAVHAKDILQPLKKDGTINKHFVDVHGTKTLQKELKISEKEIRNNVERYG